jgi:hypothetical protein
VSKLENQPWDLKLGKAMWTPVSDSPKGSLCVRKEYMGTVDNVNERICPQAGVYANLIAKYGALNDGYRRRGKV